MLFFGSIQMNLLFFEVIKNGLPCCVPTRMKDIDADLIFPNLYIYQISWKSQVIIWFYILHFIQIYQNQLNF